MGKPTRLRLCSAGAVLAMMSCGGPNDPETIEANRSALTNCVPAGNQIAWSVDPSGNPLSTCGILDLGFYPTPDPFPNDAIGSITLGPNARAVIFSNAHYGGTKTVISASAFRLPKNTSSIRVERIEDTCEVPGFLPSTGSVAFYTDYNFQGDCTTLHQVDHCVWIHGGIGEYFNPDQCMGLTNDIISSAKLGSFMNVYLYNNINFDITGGTEVLQNPNESVAFQPDFRNVLLEYRGVFRSADNAVSSVEVH